LSHSDFLGTHARIPSLGWIPDFQHLHLKDVFSDNEIKFRNRRYKNICRRCTGLIVSSYNARKYLADFAPDCINKSSVLQFVAGLNSKTDIPALEDLENRHKFKGPFFYVPNQFWGHKNHRVIIEALHILKKTGRCVLVLSTGNANDYRQPDLLKSLCTYIEQNNLKENFKMLGLVPRSDVIALMRYSISLINPSHFEGWSTTVEEAKSMGKLIILSDIEVHREQNPSGGVFFDPRNPDELAEIMWKVWTKSSREEERELSRKAQEELPVRLIEFAKRYEYIVLDTISNKPSVQQFS
jgi:glycosyltransferase involved in cell wall biosynthesis